MAQLDLPESSSEVADQVEAAPSAESELSDLINEIVKPRQTGYVYGRLDKLMGSKGIPETGRMYLTRFKRASGSSRGANVMKESPQKTATVYFVLLMEDYEPAQIKAILLPDMKRSPEQCEAVVLLEKSVNDWKVSEIIASTDGPTLGRLKELFPEDPKDHSEDSEDKMPKITILSTTSGFGDLSAATLLDKEILEEILDELNESLVVLAGPPGTGKTWAARHIGNHVTSGDKSRCRLVQFHPAMSYESFVQGLQPVADEEGRITFAVVNGAVVEFAEAAREGDDPHVFLIDEINRANVPKVLGELIYLLEYRGDENALKLQYQKPDEDPFSLPENLRFLATMNTADRSLRSIDAAIRRRFSVFELAPNPDVLEAFYAEPGNVCEVADLVEGFKQLNQKLENEIDRHHLVGHTFFMHQHLTSKRLRSTWRRQIAPLLDEYFYDDPEQAATYVFEEFWSSVTAA